MKIRTRITLLMLTISCLQTSPIHANDAAIKGLSKPTIHALVALGCIYFWYLKRKPTPVHCSWDDLLHGKNLEWFFPDMIPGFPEEPGKTKLIGENGKPVTLVCKEKKKGHGFIYLIESNAKHIAKSTSAMAIVAGVIIAVMSGKTGIESAIDSTFHWLVKYFAKFKPF